MSTELKILAAIGVGTMVIILGGVALFGKTTGARSTLSANVAPNNMPKLVRDDSHKIATESAKLTLVEFGDYQCPACGAAHPIVKKFIEENKEKVTLVFRNYPLSSHPNGGIAAEAAEAAAAQNKFWEMHDMLYENQPTWADKKDPLPIFIEYATKLGLDVEKFRQDVSTNAYGNYINRDRQDGDDLGIRATPTFFMNAKKYEGVPSIDTLNKALSEASR